ncbi:MAG: hypothetical protein ABI862_19960 [Ilumatobacteraceae bacterium]
MISRRVLQAGAYGWAVVGFVVGLVMLHSVNADARLLFLSACVVGPLAAGAASTALSRHHDRLAGALLLLSVVTPTVFAWAMNVPALLVGLALTVAPRLVVDDLVTSRG